ncbi:MAG: hypothetical protein JO257_07125 [Deltaproteobacteria bacterium]|nr:hypothetical protein [Deltaproteobacteria bacterium]
MAFRPLLLASVLIPASFVACGGSDGQPTPEGAHTHYVANKIFVPTSSTESREYGLDLNGDGTVDNQLGATLAALKSQGGFDIQKTIDTSVNDGSIILLVDFQTKSFTSSSASGIQVFLGDMPNPPACAGSADTTCGKHLTGTASFGISATSPTNAALAGKIVGGTFTGGPGKLSLQIALGGNMPIQLDLIGARVKASGITDTTIGSGTSGGAIFAGAISKDDIDNKVIPAIPPQLKTTIERDCNMLTMPPGCGCTSGSTGATIISFFDANHDCMVTPEELKMNSLVMSLLQPDVTIDGVMALSLGIKATAVGATFTVAGQGSGA